MNGGGGILVISILGLTVTKVVFESISLKPLAIFVRRLTVTKVVFEFISLFYSILK